LLTLTGRVADKKITMVFASLRFLDTLKEAASIEAGKKLNKLGITVRSGTKVRIIISLAATSHAGRS